MNFESLCVNGAEMGQEISMEKIIELGLTPYKAERLVKYAQEQSLSLQKAYYECYCQIFRVDAALLILFLFFFVSIFIGGDRDGLIVILFLVLLFCVFELCFRFHKGYLMRIRIYRRLKGF
ncbi:hypothetical protein [Citrobacter tructae]|uniref:hypothetical protein n=1 Tax=Citrobacter tructae TaxID=2562449 RepID=UPI003F560482